MHFHDAGDAACLAKLAAGYRDEWARRFVERQGPRCADDVARVSALRPRGKVLNIGGAPYAFETLAVRHGLEVVSVDIDPGRHTQVLAKAPFKTIAANYEDASDRAGIPLADFDVVCLCEVLEHMRIDLVGVLAHVREAMRGDALLYLTTPNFYFAPALARALRQRRSGPSLVHEWRKLRDLGHMGHVREYSERELRELFGFVGLRVMSCTGRNRNRVAPIWRPLCANFRLFAQELVFVLAR